MIFGIYECDEPKCIGSLQSKLAFRIAFLLKGTNKKYTERNRFPFKIHPGFEQLEPAACFSKVTIILWV